MGLSSIAVQQRGKEDEALKSFIVFSLVGSVGLHLVVLSLSNFWVREPELAEEPIEVIVLDTPRVEAAKPEPKPPPKIGGGSKPSASANTSNPASEAKSSQTASEQAIALSPSAKVENPPSPKTTSIEKPLATPKVAETLPPVPTPQPEVVATPVPTPVASLPSELIAKLKSTPTPTPLASEKPEPIPSPVATPKPIPTPLTTPPQVPLQTPIRRRIVTAASPSPRNNQPPYTPSEKPSNPVNPSNSSVSQSNVANSNKVGDRSLKPGLQNSAGNNAGTPLARSQPGNNSTRQENNNSGGQEKVATAPSNTTQPGEDLLSPRPGSGNLACRRCPDSPYPKRAERRGIEGSGAGTGAFYTPSTPIEPLPITTPSTSPIEPTPVPFESLTPSLPPE